MSKKEKRIRLSDYKSSMDQPFKSILCLNVGSVLYGNLKVNFNLYNAILTQCLMYSNIHKYYKWNFIDFSVEEFDGMLIPKYCNSKTALRDSLRL